MQAAFLRPFTIWRFKSVDGRQVVVVAKHTEPREYESEYCQIIGRVDAYAPKDALAAHAKSKA